MYANTFWTMDVSLSIDVSNPTVGPLDAVESFDDDFVCFRPNIRGIVFDRFVLSPPLDHTAMGRSCPLLSLVASIVVVPCLLGYEKQQQTSSKRGSLD
jgi:hypothetical protein